MNENTDSNNEVRTATEAQTTGIPQMAEINWADYLDPKQALRCIDEDIFGQTRLYSGPHPDRSSQLPLSEPLYECRLGWYYSPERTTSKRTGQPLKKKPTYRYLPERIGRLAMGRNQENTTTFLDDFLKMFPREKYTVFVPQELWAQYPNASSYQKPFTFIFDSFPATETPEPEIKEIGKLTLDLNSPVEFPEYSPVTVSPYTPGVTKLSLWKRFLNWLSLEY